MKQQLPILTITGSDSTGVSGVQADIRTMAALGGHAATAITAITVQTSLGIQEFFDVPAEIVGGQIEAIFNDAHPQVVKLGMVRTAATARVVADALRRYGPRHVVWDPVAVSSRGEAMVAEADVEAVRRTLSGLATLVIDRERLLPESAHGLANSLASAVAVFLNEGLPEAEAMSRAQDYVATLVLRESEQAGRSSEIYNAFTDAVARHLTEAADVQFYADRLNVSPRYLAQVTRRTAGKPPKQIIDEMMLDEARRRLLTTRETVQQVAYALGFSTQAHFCRFFKKMTGCSPSEFRRR